MRLQEPPPVLREPQIPSERERRRPPWRQRLIEIERGIAEGFRSDSAFFVDLFAGSACLMAALILGLGFMEWIVVVLSLTVVISAEMFHQALRTLVLALPSLEHRQLRKILRLGTAAVFVACAGAAVSILAVFGRRLLQTFAG